MPEMPEATVTVDQTTEGFTKACYVAIIHVEIPGLGCTGYRVRSDAITPELLEEYRLRGEKEIREAIEKFSVTRGQGIKSDEYVERDEETAGEVAVACG
jgi:hypothetical protein